MFKLLLESWRQSVSFSASTQLVTLLLQSIKRMFLAITGTSKYLYKFIIGDAVLFIIFFPIVKMVAIPIGAAGTMLQSPLENIVVFVLEFNWLLMSIFLWLAIRKRGAGSFVEYFKQAYIPYVRFLFFYYCCVFLLISLLILLGITKMPTIPWAFFLIIYILKEFVIFYWFDCEKKRFVDIWFAIENATNCLVYNFPFLLFVAILVWFLEDITMIFITGGYKISLQNSILFNNNFCTLVEHIAGTIPILKALIVRY